MHHGRPPRHPCHGPLPTNMRMDEREEEEEEEEREEE
jgi:hypothetical protein